MILRKNSPFFHRTAVVAASILVAGACATTQYQPDPGLNVLLPSPLSGPGRPLIEREQLKNVDLAWRQLLAGDFNQARASCAAAKGAPPAELLVLDIDHVERNTDITTQISDLVEQHPYWAAAWLSLSIVAEKEGDEVLALEAATRGADLWVKKPWTARPGNLRTRWITDRLSTSEAQLAEDHGEQALMTIERALMHDPADSGALLIKGRILLALDRSEDAEKVLVTLEDQPEALFLRAQIAESRSDWMTAMSLYRLLPSDYAKRQSGLARAQLRWRLSVLPGYVHEALASTQLTRAQLAIILIALAPDAESMEGGTVPLLPDIVELPYQREILSAIRVDLLTIDRVEHRFHPNRQASRHEVQDATLALGHLLGLTPPVWCSGDADPETTGCTSLSDPISGATLADILMDMMQETD